MTKTKKQISRIHNTEPSLILSGKQLVRQFQKEGRHEVEGVEITLVSESVFNRGLTLRDKDLEGLAMLGIQATREDISRIFNEVVNVLQHPQNAAKHLRSLDEELGKEMAELGYTKSDLPQYLIPARGKFIAGPPPQDYRVRDQGRLLDKILLEREKAAGMNRSGFTPKFVGFIDGKKADNFVREGHVFAEDVQVDNLILHSKYAHRLQLEIMREAAKTGKINLKLASGQQLEVLSLLQMMVTVKHGQSNLWQLMIDNEADSRDKAAQAGDKKFVLTNTARQLNAHEEAYKIENFSYSCRSPQVTNSVITCFGEELGLPNLQHYLLNSHWKQAAQMVGKARKIISGEIKESALSNFAADVASVDYYIGNNTWPILAEKFVNFFKGFRGTRVSDEISTDFPNLYSSCMKSLVCMGIASTSIIRKSPLTKSPEQAAASGKYQQYQDGEPSLIERVFGLTTIDKGIKKKVTTPNEFKKTDQVFDEYIERKSEKVAAENQPKSQPQNTTFAQLFSPKLKIR